jgi:hypothetical protein
VPPPADVSQVIEYETIARIIGHLGIRLSMVAYPVVSVHKVGPGPSGHTLYLLCESHALPGGIQVSGCQDRSLTALAARAANGDTQPPMLCWAAAQHM